MNKKGFTLVELLAVIVVLAIIIVLLGNAVGEALKTARGEAFVLQAQTIKKELDEKCVLNNEISQNDLTVIGTRTSLTVTSSGDEITLSAAQGTKYANISEDSVKKMPSGYSFVGTDYKLPVIKFTATCTVK